MRSELAAMHACGIARMHLCMKPSCWCVWVYLIMHVSCVWILRIDVCDTDTDTCKHGYMHTPTHVHTGAYIHHHMYTRVYTPTRVHTDTYIHQHMYTRIHTYTNPCTHGCIQTPTHVYMNANHPQKSSCIMLRAHTHYYNRALCDLAQYNFHKA